MSKPGIFLFRGEIVAKRLDYSKILPKGAKIHVTGKLICFVCGRKHDCWDALMLHYSVRHPRYKINGKNPLGMMANNKHHTVLATK